MKTRSIQASTGLAAAALALMATFASPAIAAPTGDDQLVQPKQLIVDHSLPPQQLAALIRAARLYDTFWTTGDEAQAREALAPDFMDRTLPPGRPQGLAGRWRPRRDFMPRCPTCMPRSSR